MSHRSSGGPINSFRGWRDPVCSLYAYIRYLKISAMSIFFGEGSFVLVSSVWLDLMIPQIEEFRLFRGSLKYALVYIEMKCLSHLMNLWT